MVAFRNLFFFVTAASAIVKRDDYQTVTNDLTNLNSKISVLSSVASAYTGGVSGALPVQSAVNAMDQEFTQTNSDFSNSNITSGAQWTTILNYLKNTLTGTIRNTLGVLVNKKVKSGVSSLCYSATPFVGALVTKAPASQKPTASAISTSVTSWCNSALLAINGL